MSDFTAAPYRGDAGIPHAAEENYTLFIGGCWVSLGLQYMKDLTEFRPMFSPDHVMVVAEEAFKRRQLKAGKPYTGKLPSPIPADRLPENKGKTPRIVKWKMDRLW